MAEIDKEQLWAELEALGEDEVRTKAALDIYGTNSRKRRLVDEWLAQIARRREAASQSEQIEIARSAKDAAWVAAAAARAASEAARDAASTAQEHAETAVRAERAAREANTRYTIMLVIAAISAAVTIIGLFYQRS